MKIRNTKLIYHSNDIILDLLVEVFLKLLFILIINKC